MSAHTKQKTAVVFHYFEKDQSYRDNLLFFLNCGMAQAEHVFLVIVGTCSISLPASDKITCIRSENKNNDYGGYAQLLRSHRKQILTFDAVIFVNSSVRGPFLPAYVARDWIDFFTPPLQGNVHLVGSSVNILPAETPEGQAYRERYPTDDGPCTHIQTTIYGLSRQALQHLLDIGFYGNEETLSKIQVITDYEIRLTREIMLNGWRIRQFLPIYDDIDYHAASYEDPNPTNQNGDPLWLGKFFGRTATPMELVFIKTNRALLPDWELASYTYTALKQSMPLPALDEQTRELLSRCKAKMIQRHSDLEAAKHPAGFYPRIRKTLRPIKKRIREILRPNHE